MSVIRGGLAMMLGFATATAARGAPQLIEFDAPLAGKVNDPACTPLCGTLAYGNNARGAVVGYYTTKDVVPYAFIRSQSGTITPFEAKGAGLGKGLNEGTVAYAINDAGEIAGQYQDANVVYHGYLRKADGRITRFDAPNAGAGANQGTVPITINNHGTEAGYYIDSTNILHGFVREHGTVTSFDPPGSTMTRVFYNGINNAGTVDGYYIDASLLRHGYVRTSDGNITSFDCPGAGTGAEQGTSALAINDAGAITGYVITKSGNAEGIVRTPSGTCTDFKVPGAAEGTLGVSIDRSGTIAGVYFDANRAAHGFVRDPDGKFKRFIAPDGGTGVGQGTTPYSNHGPHGAASGIYVDGNNLNHGFIWTR